MKKITGLTAILLTILSSTQAQTKTAPTDSLFNRLKIGVIEAQKKATAAKRDELPKETIETVEKGITTRLVIPETDRIQKKLDAFPVTSPNPRITSSKGKGEADLIAYFNIPAPAGTLSAAYATPGLKDKTSAWDLHLQKLERKAKELAELALKHNKLNDVYQREGTAGLQKGYAKESDKSAVIQSMGGTEKLMAMSESERKAAALQAADKIKQNPGAMMGSNNPGMNKLMQEMMQNPELAKKFEKMSAAEKEAFLKPYVSQSGPRDEAQHQKIMKEKNDNEYAMNVLQIIQRMGEQQREAANRYAERIRIFEEGRNSSLEKLRSWALRTCEALPIINGGPGVGMTKDQDELTAIQKVVEAGFKQWAEASIAFYSKQWATYRLDAINAIAEFNEFYGNYEYGKAMKDVNAFSGAYIEPQIAEAAHGVLGWIGQLTSAAREMTVTARNAYDSWIESRKTRTIYMCEGS